MTQVRPISGLSVTLGCCLLGLAAGCTSSEQQAEPSSPKTDRPLEFTSRTDTINMSRSNGSPPADEADSNHEIRYMVQIGAFSNPLNASRAQEIARQRFGVPVLNDYHTGLRLYQVRIGFFEDRESAAAFRQQLISEYPDDYRDAWIVQLIR